MLRRMLQAALLAGFLTAIAYTVVQAVAVTPLILHAETFEAAGGGHDHGDAVAAHSHDGAAADLGEGAWAPADGFERTATTFLANLVLAIGFAFVLVAGFAIRGREVDAKTGVMWGLAGFAAVTFAPALGLAPELPGAAAGDLVARQAWMIGTIAATALGIALIAFAKPVWLRALGVVPILVPHLIGAPLAPAGAAGTVPPELAAEFTVWSLAAMAFFWAVLGALTGWLYGREGGEPAGAAQPA